MNIYVKDILVAVGQGFNVLEANMKRPLKARTWRAAGVHRPWLARREVSGTLEAPGTPDGRRHF